MQREQEMFSWLLTVWGEQTPVLQPVSGDASFRRYFRAQLADGRHYIVMDAPPQQEDCQPFVKVAKLLRDGGVNVPQIVHANLAQGWLVLTDFGDETLLVALNTHPAHDLYFQAIQTLLGIQKIIPHGVVPEYDRERLLRELQLFETWYLKQHLGASLTTAERAALDVLFAHLLDNIAAQPIVLVHRDYHSRNLMVTEQGLGVLDFQDAVAGAITYDLVSLLRDAYVDWDEAQVIDWAIRYWDEARRAGLPVHADFGEFYRDFEWMGLQRHLKVLGIFARLNVRDGKSAYLNDIPRVLHYVRATAARYRAFSPLLALLDRIGGDGVQQGYTF
jgi:aminoglycoside/choline kinase family phosphotransferase